MVCTYSSIFVVPSTRVRKLNSGSDKLGLDFADDDISHLLQSLRVMIFLWQSHAQRYQTLCLQVFNKDLKAMSPSYRRIFEVGILQIECWAIEKRSQPWRSCSPLQWHGIGDFSGPTPKSLCQWGRPRPKSKGFIQLCKLSKINPFMMGLLYFSPPLTFNAPKIMDSHFLHSPYRLHFLSSPSSAILCFWLVVEYNCLPAPF